MLLSDQTIPKGRSYTFQAECFDDLNLYSLNITCDNGYNHYVDNLNTTDYDVSAGGMHPNVTITPTSSTICRFDTTDAHTDNDITDVLNEDTVFAVNDLIVIDTGDTMTGIIQYTGDESTDISLNYSDNSKVKFEYDFTEIVPEEGETVEYSFVVNGNTKVEYIDNTAHNGWFVVDNEYWVDFDTDIDAEYTVTRLSDTEYEVMVETEETTLPFNSLGVINRNSQTQNIIVSDEIILTTCGNDMYNATVQFAVVVILLGGIASYILRKKEQQMTWVWAVISIMVVAAFVLAAVLGC
jgi:hypothetical protein